MTRRAQAEAVTETIRAGVDQNAATRADLVEIREPLTWRVVLIVAAPPLHFLAGDSDRLHP